jgi:hypothetical protein
VFINGGEWVFDYHGYSAKPRFLAHIWRGARQRWPGWDGMLVELPPDVLISEQKSRTYDGLWLREPGQFLHDAMPRAGVPGSLRVPTQPNGIDLESAKGRRRSHDKGWLLMVPRATLTRLLRSERMPNRHHRLERCRSSYRRAASSWG